MYKLSEAVYITEKAAMFATYPLTPVEEMDPFDWPTVAAHLLPKFRALQAVLRESAEAGIECGDPETSPAMQPALRLMHRRYLRLT